MTANSNRCHLLFALVVMLLSHSMQAEEAKQTSQTIADPALEAMRQKWRLWERLDMSDGRKVTKARLVMQKYIFSEPQEVTLDVTISDGEILKFLEKGFWNVHIRAPMKQGAIPGVLPYGTLTCTMSDGEVGIHIYPHCFALTDVPDELRDHGPFDFHSPKLAYVIDAILKSNGHAPFTPEQLEGLTGERSIKASIKYLKKELAESNAFDNRG
jgi:hypothetical protein